MAGERPSLSNALGRFMLRSIRCGKSLSRSLCRDARERPRLLIPEPRLRDVQAEESEALSLLNQVIDSFTPERVRANAELHETFGRLSRTCRERLSAPAARSKACATKFGSRLSDGHGAGHAWVSRLRGTNRLPRAGVGSPICMWTGRCWLAKLWKADCSPRSTLFA